MFLEKEIERCKQGSNLRENPFRFQVQLLNDSAITPRRKYLYSFVWWKLFASADILMLALFVEFLLRIVVLVVSNRCGLHVLSRKSNWESLVRQSQFFANTSFGSCSQILLNNFLRKKIERFEHGSNMRGKFPLDFKSNALTTRPSQLCWHFSYLDGVCFRPWTDFCLHFCSFCCWGVSCCAGRFQTLQSTCPLQEKFGNLWFASLSFLRTQVLVRVPKFFWISFWEKRSKAASRVRTCAGSCHWSSRSTP